MHRIRALLTNWLPPGGLGCAALQFWQLCIGVQISWQTAPAMLNTEGWLDQVRRVCPACCATCLATWLQPVLGGKRACAVHAQELALPAGLAGRPSSNNFALWVRATLICIWVALQQAVLMQHAIASILKLRIAPCLACSASASLASFTKIP
jgi:hypothetical protein